MDDPCTVIPSPVRRRLLLNLCGWRLRAGVWHAPSGAQTRSEAAVDAMSDLAFAVFIAPWLGSACHAALN
jgi:hypothetical protein